MSSAVAAQPVANSKCAIVGRAPALLELLERARRTAASSLPVVVSGESGTGKELLARFVHDHSSRAGGPYIVVNCAAFPRELIDSELFGHERGAFTGAHGGQAGWFQAAHGGTLVLDEIGELPLPLQPKLLRILEDGMVTRVGGRKPTDIDVRIVAVSNRDLLAECAAKQFRLDLYHRLSGVTLVLPPLRQRTQDLCALVNHFAQQAARNQGVLGNNESDQAVFLSPAAQQRLAQHPWPGNLRELKHLVARTVALHGYPFQDSALLTEIVPPASQGPAKSQACHLQPAAFARDSPAPPNEARDNPGCGWIDLNGKTWSQLEAELIRYQLAQAHGNRRLAARALGISRTTLYERLRQMPEVKHHDTFRS